MADNLEALYAQLLAGGTPRVINPVDVRGPNIAPMQFASMGESKGGASGFATLADGIMGYLDKRKKEKEAAAGTGVSDAPPPANTFGGGGSQYQGHPAEQVRPQPRPENPFGGGGAQYRPAPTGGAPYPEVTTSGIPQPYVDDERGSQTGPYDLELEKINAWLTMNGAPPIRR